MIKKIINIALAIALTASLAGCGSKSAARDAAGDSAAAQTAAVQEESSDQSDGIEDASEGENTQEEAAESEQGATADSIEIPETPYVRDDGGVSIDVFAMDTYMNLLAYGDRAEEAVLAAAQEIHRIDDMLSTGNPESEISKLNAAGTGHVSEDTLYLIKESKTLYEETNGLFDIAIYPVMKLWGFPSQEYRVPTEEEIKTGLTLTDASKIAIGGAAAAAPASASADEGKTEVKTTAKTEEASKAKAEDADSKTAEEEKDKAKEDTAAKTADAEKDKAKAEGAEAAEAAEAKNGEAEKEKDKKEDKAAETEKASVPEAGDGGAATDQPADAEEPAAADQPAAAATQETEAADKSAQTLVLFGASGMEIDLGGIAKGFTSSRVMEVFREYGIEHGLVSLGGNVQALGTKENGKPWRVAIQNPESELDYLGILDIEDKCVITSGGYERFFEKDGVRYHHIIDPRTGYPADSGIISATIISKDGTLADGLSTSLFIMGKDQAEKYWRKNADRFDYILEDEAGKLYVTEGAAAILTTEAEMEVVKK